MGRLIKTYTIHEDQLFDLESVPAIGVHSLAGLATGLFLASAIVIVSNATPFWIGAAWGTGVCGCVFWAASILVIRNRNKIIKSIRSNWSCSK